MRKMTPGEKRKLVLLIVIIALFLFIIVFGNQMGTLLKQGAARAGFSSSHSRLICFSLKWATGQPAHRNEKPSGDSTCRSST
jgi:hypothetical protein